MKKNKLVLTAGILMLVCSLACLFLAIYSSIALVDYWEAYQEALLETAETIEEYDFLMLTMMLVYAVAIAMYVAQAVVDIVFGVKLIVKYAKGVPFEKYKSMAIAVQVICYVFAGITMGGDYITSGIIFALSLTSGILLSCAISQNKKEREAMLTSSYGSFKDDGGRINLENVPNGKGKEQPFNEKAYADELSTKIASIKALKDEGLIDDKEYSKMVHKLLGLDNVQKGDGDEK